MSQYQRWIERRRKEPLFQGCMAMILATVTVFLTMPLAFIFLGYYPFILFGLGFILLVYFHFIKWEVAAAVMFIAMLMWGVGIFLFGS